MKNRFGLGVLAYLVPNLRAWLRLAPDSVQAVLRRSRNLSKGHHHSFRLSVDAGPGIPLRLDVQAGVCATQWQPAGPWPTLCSIRCCSVVELYHACRCREKYDDLGCALSCDRNGVHCCAVDTRWTTDSIRLCELCSKGLLDTWL